MNGWFIALLAVCLWFLWDFGGLLFLWAFSSYMWYIGRPLLIVIVLGAVVGLTRAVVRRGL